MSPEMYYKIESSDGREFRVSLRALQQSKVLSTLALILDYSLENVEISPVIPLTNIDGNTLELVFRWCEQRDEKIINEIDDTKLYSLVCAADYLGIEGLVTLVRNSMAHRINAPELKVEAAPPPTPIRKCSRCGSTETCKWRQCRSPNILCNACFIYHRKFNKDRPESAAEAYESRKRMKKTH